MLVAFFIILAVAVIIALAYNATSDKNTRRSRPSSGVSAKSEDADTTSAQQLAQELVETAEVPQSSPDRQKEHEAIRDKIVEQDGLTSLWRIKFEVKGGSYRSEAAQEEYICLTPGNELKLKAEPDNAYDEYAVRVYSDRKFIGYVDRKHSRAVAYVLEQMCDAECLVWDNSYADELDEPEYMEACLFVSDAFKNEERVRGFIPPIDQDERNR